MCESSFVENVLYLADSYKVRRSFYGLSARNPSGCTFQLTHHNQYPERTTYVYSYFESRGGKFPEVRFSQKSSSIRDIIYPSMEN